MLFAEDVKEENTHTKTYGNRKNFMENEKC